MFICAGANVSATLRPMAAPQRLKIPPDASSNPDARREMPTDRQVAVAVGALTMAAEPSRLRILCAVSDEELDVATLAALAGISATAASQHLAKLRLAGLVVARREGRHVLYSARGAHVRRLIAEALFQADHQVSGEPVHD